MARGREGKSLEDEVGSENKKTEFGRTSQNSERLGKNKIDDRYVELLQKPKAVFKIGKLLCSIVIHIRVYSKNTHANASYTRSNSSINRYG